MSTSRTVALSFLLPVFVLAACGGRDTTAGESVVGPSAANMDSHPPPPIATEQLTARHQFTDDVAIQVRVKPQGRPNNVVNLTDASNLAVLRFTIQPGVRFPWHTHPGPVIVAVAQGTLVFVYGDDCVQRTYPSGTAFADAGTSVHYAFNPTGGETVLVATFLGAPAAPNPLTVPVAPAQAAALDAKCGLTAASAHTH
ncbi:hypothetical protein BH23GEM2_BH23GEM2_16520 [soil metagenome]